MKILTTRKYQNQNNNQAKAIARHSTNSSSICDEINFGNNQAIGLLPALKNNRITKILNKIKTISTNRLIRTQEVIDIDNNLFLGILDKIKGKDCFRIYSPEGKLLYRQKRKNYGLTTKTMQNSKNNVVLISSKHQLSLNCLFPLYKYKAAKVFSYNQNAKHVEIFSFPPINPEKIKEGEEMLEDLDTVANQAALIHGVQQAMASAGKVILTSGEDMTKSIHESYFDKFLQRLNINKKIVFD